MTDDLIKKFDEEVENDPYSFPAFLRFNYDAYQQQLKTVDDLRARIAALEAALKPFSDKSHHHLEGAHWMDPCFTVEECRAAREALEEKE